MLLQSLVPAGFAIPRGLLHVALGLLYSVGFILGWVLHYPYAQRDAHCEERIAFGSFAGLLKNLGD